jgi:hypothetical protein
MQDSLSRLFQGLVKACGSAAFSKSYLEMKSPKPTQDLKLKKLWAHSYCSSVCILFIQERQYIMKENDDEHTRSS